MFALTSVNFSLRSRCQIHTIVVFIQITRTFQFNVLGVCERVEGCVENRQSASGVVTSIFLLSASFWRRGNPMLAIACRLLKHSLNQFRSRQKKKPNFESIPFPLKTNQIYTYLHVQVSFPVL
jgi:hypothetical protein